MLKKIWIKREISLLHLLMLLAGKLFIGIYVGMIIAHVYPDHCPVVVSIE